MLLNSRCRHCRAAGEGGSEIKVNSTPFFMCQVYIFDYLTSACLCVLMNKRKDGCDAFFDGGFDGFPRGVYFFDKTFAKNKRIKALKSPSRPGNKHQNMYA